MKKLIIPEPIRFILGGAPGLLLNLIILYISSLFFEKEGIKMIIISIIAFILREATSFTVHKLWTFKSRKDVKKEAVYYTISVLIVTTINTVVLFLFIKITNFDVVLSQIIVSLLLFKINLEIVKMVFKKPKTRYA
ncbi:MAG: Cell wall teichoic acid glycosylation protein GtcA [Candidatus Nomurabacteria bacterium GW2011_GWE1_32_28]|uniref:Cell wall teichoic acid glycosylation protein GtcA n=1 Tax=Candidatus Nomurabacteria bacterium GW2011_GWF1_31_48 TaxID=1618767 RepID=A0A0F9YGG2_9BACT|nr:MAG: Cell wall teichoic acid glycosylation protein GtcA [Candidatus Nomurabacteria bacterium GW2011_GWF2_30_133]KKP29072.1 MAG: Cell wall teichoic acid glycosylation protein GtcA [Candidatus Nomurabacteria bacterium GW2011_GWE2_31_40]KKP30518.1 MAG: Cell wall teichoic acid glycosylation protein GtcA [Candidatus Nomurabacteria bacterium GW2011_GWF1_31_48]KKP35003.1 MAG: Cell wall teichoic acid glycosylation protein GtcA [Candidatus Nomurabacteria bacterium GW2011_GWE1_32_28]